MHNAGQDSDPKPMTIVELRAENVKKLRAIAIRPKGSVVEISGANGQGKTSVLDSIWWALTGTSNIQAVPIRSGEEEAVIRLDLGPIKVIRKFRQRDDQPWTTSLVVENAADGTIYKSPQKMLDALVGELAFDPLEFSKLKPAEQFEALQRFVPGVDFGAMDRLNEADMEARRIAKKDAAAEQARAGAIVVRGDLPNEAPDAKALVEQLAKAGEINGSIETRKANRQSAATKIAEEAAIAESLEAGIPDMLQRISETTAAETARIDAEIERLRLAREDMAQRSEREIQEAESNIRSQIAAHRRSASDLKAKLDAADPLPAPIDTDALLKRIEDARTIGAAIERRNHRDQLLAAVRKHEDEAKRLTKSLESRARQRQSAIAEAKMPVGGLGFGKREVLLNGLPFAQASHAEQLKASISIAMASNPRLRLLRVTQGSDLDDNSFALLGEMADEAGYQVWVETVQSDRESAIVIEDGSVVAKAPSLQAAE